MYSKNFIKCSQPQPPEEKKYLAYISGGKTGDFIQQLSVIYEKYLVDNKPVILYISNQEPFQYGVEKAYHDLFPVVSIQPYIKEFKIHNNELYDFNLSKWRDHAYYEFKDDYLGWMMKEYNIQWGAHKWLHNIPKNDWWENKVLINTTPNRFPTMFDWGSLFEDHPTDSFVFIGFEPEHYTHFSNVIQMIPYYCPATIMEMAVILNSCKMFVGSLSMPLSIALGLHIPLRIGLYNNTFDLPAFRNMTKHIIQNTT